MADKNPILFKDLLLGVTFTYEGHAWMKVNVHGARAVELDGAVLDEDYEKFEHDPSTLDDPWEMFEPDEGPCLPIANRDSFFVVLEATPAILLGPFGDRRFAERFQQLRDEKVHIVQFDSVN